MTDDFFSDIFFNYIVPFNTRFFISNVFQYTYMHRIALVFLGITFNPFIRLYRVINELSIFYQKIRCDNENMRLHLTLCRKNEKEYNPVKNILYIVSAK